MEAAMESISRDVDAMEWGPAQEFYGTGAVVNGREIVQLKLLSDRRDEGGGIAWLVRFAPPPGKVIKIVALARSDEHILELEGGRSTKSGRPVRGAAGYGLNTRGQPHSAMIAEESTAFVLYTGEPDEVRSLEVVDAA